MRDREKREVDFLLLREARPWLLIEAKPADLAPAPSLAYFQQRLKAPFALQIIAGQEARRGVVPAARFLGPLP